ncbi:MAG: response regulator, partial [candidate division Zixibacteria bacterium]|nr:response regulator [candidate division Zixibacteria bacterium]
EIEYFSNNFVKTSEPFISEIKRNNLKIGYIKVYNNQLNDSLSDDEIKIINLTSNIISNPPSIKNDKFQDNTKLKSLNTLASGLAHNFNNLLTGILGNITFAKMNIDENTELFNVLSEAEQAGWMARNLTHQLLVFSEGSFVNKQKSDIKQIIFEIVKTVKENYENGIKINLHEPLEFIELDKEQIKNSFTNILLLALKSQNENNQTDINIEVITIEDSVNNTFSCGKFVKISITDNSQGITEDELENMLDPFYKSDKYGSGLTIASAFNVILKHKGFLTLNSVIGTGNSFEILLPIGEEKEIDQTGSLKILIMDDEELLRTVAARACKSFGYKVDVASDGEEAIRLYQNSFNDKHPYDAVILDIIVPNGLGGQETIKKLLDFDPNIKALACSGYLNDPIMGDPGKFGFKGVIGKPFKFNDLNDAIKKILNQ